MDSREGHTVVCSPRKRRRHSLGSAPSLASIRRSMDAPNPVHSTCPACRNLDWNSYDVYELGGNPCERQLIVSFCKVVSGLKAGCQSCTLLYTAVTEFSKPLLRLDVEFVGDLIQCALIITLRRGYSVIVNVLEESDDVVGSYFSIEIYKTPDRAGNNPFLVAPKDVIAEPDIDAVIKFVESNRRVCEREHRHWPLENPTLPTRILRISKDFEELKIKLIETKGMLGKYMALSHCWGQGGTPLATTRDTIRSHLEGIQLAMLPKTFRDAVQITAALDISYLWIDSLCIIQSDQHDWEVEAAKMKDVYSNAFITLAATGSSSGLGGCLFPRNHLTDFGISISHEDSRLLSDGAVLPDGIGVRYETRSHMQVMGEHLATSRGGAPLLTRAWVLQERFLSPVFLHFHREELVWECHESLSCECGFLDWERVTSNEIRRKEIISLKAHFIKLSKNLENVKTTQEAYDFWLKFTESFTCLDITVASDQLPAVMGIARRLSTTIPGPYLLGIWSGDIARGLMWRKQPYQQAVRVDVLPGCHRATWSWASVSIISSKKYGLRYQMMDVSPFEIDPRFTTRENGLEDNMFVFAKQCKLLLSGACIVCKIECRSPATNTTPSHLLHFRDEDVEMYEDITCRTSEYDTSCGLRSSRTVCCLLVGSKLDPLDGGQWSLVIEQLPWGEYERIGLAKVDLTKDWFGDAEVKQIVLV